MNNIHIVGMAWYKQENFARLLTLFEDGGQIRLSYREWLKAAEAGIDRHHRAGRKVIRIDIDPVEFPRWCEAAGLATNAQARIAYTNFQVGNIGRMP